MKDIVICFDIGGTTIKAAIIDKEGNIYHKESFITCHSLEISKQKQYLIDCVSAIKSKATDDMNIIGLALCSPGMSAVVMSIEAIRGSTGVES